MRVCRTGESFDSIALDEYGDEKYAAEILCANPEYDGVLMFQGGEEIRMPVTDETDGAEKAPWRS